MRFKDYWAYDFTCDLSMEQMLSEWNAAGPWQWELRDSGWYGDYLNARPCEGVRVRIHEYPSTCEAGTFVGLREKGFTVLAQIHEESAAEMADIDRVLRELLSKIVATNLTPIEPYD